MLQHSQAHVLGFCDGRNPLLSIKFCSRYVWLQITHKLRGFKQQSFLLFLTILWIWNLFFPPLGQLVTFSWWVGWSTGATRLACWWGWWDARISRDCSPESYTGLLQHGTHDGQFHHLRGHSCTENIPRDCKLPGFFRHGFGNCTVWLLPLCRGHSSSFKGRGQNPCFSVRQLSRNLWPSLVFHIPSPSLPSFCFLE